MPEGLIVTDSKVTYSSPSYALPPTSSCFIAYLLAWCSSPGVSQAIDLVLTWPDWLVLAGVRVKGGGGGTSFDAIH